MILSPHVTSPHCTDFSSLRALLGSPRFAGKTGEELAVAIWEFLVDKREGIYHFWSALERLNGADVRDPLKLLNCFGWAICGVNANLLATLYREAGFDARIGGLKGHVVEEVFYDGAWHLFDGDLQAYHRKHPPDADQIASYAECIADPTLISRQENPSEPYYLPDRRPEQMASLYDVPGATHDVFDEQAHTMDFVLRPGERLERNAFGEGKWIWFSNFTQSARRFKREWTGRGPRERFEPHRQFGNGTWVYQPRLTGPWQDFELGVLEADGLEASTTGVLAGRKGQSGCVFDFDSPYVYTGTPAVKGKRRARDGCIVEATLRLAGGGSSARISLAVSPDLPWKPVWEARGGGRRSVRLDLTEHVVNAYRYLLRVEFDAAETGACALEALRVSSAFMVSPASLGPLVEGVNPLSVRFGDRDGLPTRRWVVETNFADEQDVRAKTHRLRNLRFVPDSPDRIRPARAGRNYEIVFKLDAPAHGRLQRVYAFGSFRGKDPADSAKGRVAAYLAGREAGPWRKLFETPVPGVANRWHFAAQGELTLPRPTRTAFVKFVGKAGMNAAKVRAHWLDDRAGKVHVPLAITHVWAEASGCFKCHTEPVDRSVVPYPYRIICGPQPRLRSVVFQAGSARR